MYPKPRCADAPFVLVWYHFAGEANLPMLTVGDAWPPHIPWTLLGDYPVDGRRGVGAREDEGIYAMPDRVITTPERYVIPRDDPRTGEPLVYQLEPGSHWLSATDRRFPNPPRIPLEPASGNLTVSIQQTGWQRCHAWPIRPQPDLPTHSHQPERGRNCRRHRPDR